MHVFLFKVLYHLYYKQRKEALISVISFLLHFSFLMLMVFFMNSKLCGALNVNKKSVDRDLDVYRNLLSKLVQAKELLKEYVDR